MVLGSLKFESHGYKVDLGKKWELYDYEKTVKKYTKVNIFSASEKEIVKKLDELKVEYTKGVDKCRLVDSLWKYCRRNITGPGWLVYPPKIVSPLANQSVSPLPLVLAFQSNL